MSVKLFTKSCNTSARQHLKKIIESLRLEKTSKIIKPNCHPNTTMPAKQCPKVQYLHGFLNPARDGDSTISWAACSNS